MDFQYSEPSLVTHETLRNVLACDEPGKAKANRGATLPYYLAHKEEA
ncbi:hypothetical protein ACFQUU_25750 [Herbaspirillum sp. GCM10030257]